MGALTKYQCDRCKKISDYDFAATVRWAYRGHAEETMQLCADCAADMRSFGCNLQPRPRRNEGVGE
jgi:hypothetical protein